MEELENPGDDFLFEQFFKICQGIDYAVISTGVAERFLEAIFYAFPATFLKGSRKKGLYKSLSILGGILGETFGETPGGTATRIS